MSDLLSYKLISYKSHNKPNQSIFLTMSTSIKTRSSSISSKETLDIVPTTSPAPPSLSRDDLDNIHNDIKAITEKHHSDMKTQNFHISAMLTKLTNTSSKTDKQEEELTEISCKLSTYEDLLKNLA